ncbi:membrane-targeted effector domain-containing toxin [Pseudomonas sp. KK4]|uniref:membrane-targeted effector domain-containing toxin n=1 Tax=Pseudomonas sp. KK4 TaxID=1855729 RepID=UPI00097CA959|nr:membrane-targeted effector domain-containing toxin [Pseudomonas sp. KK4]
MPALETRPLPNAADKAALKVIATHVVKACPSLHDTAHGVAAQLLEKYGVVGLDPDQVYFHRFKTAQNLAPSFTGWQHYGEKPYESQTLTQLVIHRFRATDQDNADLLDLYGGFYTAGPEAENFDASNEVRLHGSDVLKDFWAIDFNTLYRNKLQAFWSDCATDFRTLAKSNFLSKAVQARDSGHLTDQDFQTAISAVIGPLTWPITLHTLQTEATSSQVYALDIAGHAATDILRIGDPKGRQILYVPGDTQVFHVLETAGDLHWWVLQQLNEKGPRELFLKHFPLADRQQISEGISDLMNRLVNTWGQSDHHLVNQNDQAVIGDAFSWLREGARTAMFAEADLSLTSKSELLKKLWIGYLSAGLKVFGPMAAVGWPVALPVIGAGIASMGLNIDQAVNGKTSAERKAGVIAAILNGIDVLFNLPFLKGTGPLAEVGAEVDAAEAAEWAQLSEELARDRPTGTFPVPQDLSPIPSEPEQVPEIAQTYQSNELLDGLEPETEPGKFQGIYRLDGEPPFAILMNDTAYYVRYFNDSRGGGFWAIVDPARPNQLAHSMPVRLNAEGTWERMTRLGLQGGGQCLGKECTVELELDVRDSATAEPEPPSVEPGTLPAAPDPQPQPQPQPQPSTSTDIRPVKTPYDVDPARQSELRRWAMQIRETHVHVQIGPNGDLIVPDRYALNFAAKARALLSSAARFYHNLSWGNLPPRPGIAPINASTTVADALTQALEAAPGLVIGETPGRITSMRLIIENMPALARQGLKTLYVRRLLSDFVQTDLNAYFKSGVMPEELERYLSRLGTDPAGRFNELELVKTARQNGVRIQATDCAATYRKTLLFTRIEEQMCTNHLTADILFMDKTLNDVGKWIVLTGVESTNTFRGLAGISELEGGIGLRIEEVSPGHGESVVADPGIEIERGPFSQGDTQRGTFHHQYADLLLRLEAPAVSRSEKQISRLLYRPGMYVFEGSEGTYTLIHRSQSNSILRTAVQTLADGRISINRPAWSHVSGVHFDNLAQLSTALEQMGLSLQSRLPG